MEWPPEVVIDWLLENLGEPKQVVRKNGLEYQYNEFLVEDRKHRLNVNVEAMCGFWHAFKSGENGDFIDLVSQFHEVSRNSAFRLLVKKYGAKLDPDLAIRVRAKTRKPPAPPVSQLLPEKCFPLKNEDQFARPYIAFLHRRGVSGEFIAKCYYSLANNYNGKSFNFRPYVIMPYYDRYDKIHYWTARAIYNGIEPRYYNAPEAGNFVYNIDRIDTDTVVMTEGVFKAEKFSGCAIATGGKVLSDEQKRQITAKNFSHIIIMPDNEKYDLSPKSAIDNARALRKLSQNVSIFDWTSFCKHHNLKIKDIDEWKAKSRVSLEDIRPFLVDNLYEAEIRYRLNESIPQENK